MRCWFCRIVVISSCIRFSSSRIAWKPLFSGWVLVTFEKSGFRPSPFTGRFSFPNDPYSLEEKDILTLLRMSWLLNMEIYRWLNEKERTAGGCASFFWLWRITSCTLNVLLLRAGFSSSGSEGDSVISFGEGSVSNMDVLRLRTFACSAVSVHENTLWGNEDRSPRRLHKVGVFGEPMSPSRQKGETGISIMGWGETSRGFPTNRFCLPIVRMWLGWTMKGGDEHSVSMMSSK